MENINPLIIFIVSATLIWLAVLTIFIVKIFRHYQNLIKGVNEGNLEKILRKILVDQDLKEKQILDINNKILILEQEGLKHIQRVGFIRFNPFNETGGDNSFTLCLLDGNSNGILLTGLHTREKTRMYAKKIENGKSKHELSKEEIKAIQGISI
jgi:hypothetical protein